MSPSTEDLDAVSAGSPASQAPAQVCTAEESESTMATEQTPSGEIEDVDGAVALAGTATEAGEKNHMEQEPDSKSDEENEACVPEETASPLIATVTKLTETHKLPTKRVAGMKMAPVDIPWERRLQTAAAISVMAMIPTCLLIYAICVFYPMLWWFTIPYTIYWLTDKAPERGGRRVQFIRNLKWWCYLRDYFPAQLIRDEGCQLDPKRNYIFGYHPHGILSIGAITNFLTEASHVSELFPEITLHVATLVENMKLPVLRELIMAMGAISVSRKSLEYLFRSGAGQSALIVVGGAAEALDTKPKTANLTLNKRRGFVRLALQNGAGLVPVFCFNENDLFRLAVDPEKGTPLRNAQEKMMKVMGFSLPLFHGRGVFQYSFGFLPVRKPLVTVVGKAVECPLIENPSDEEIEKYHAMYVESLTQLYNKYKNVYAPQRKTSLVLVS